MKAKKLATVSKFLTLIIRSRSSNHWVSPWISCDNRLLKDKTHLLTTPSEVFSRIFVQGS